MPNKPQFITLIDIECVSTDDLTGDDQLVGRFGDLISADFFVGQFYSNIGVKIDLGIEKIIPV